MTVDLFLAVMILFSPMWLLLIVTVVFERSEWVWRKVDRTMGRIDTRVLGRIDRPVQR
jgi:hypothetical protein